MCRFSRQGWWGMAVACLLIPLTVQAELTVIYDNGQTEPLAPYLDVFDSTDTLPQQSPVIAGPSLGAADPRTWLPLRSPGLTPGAVAARSHNRPFSHPLFLLGSDARSRQWLQTHRERLKAIGAVGMLVQADTLSDLHTIARLADGLSILPASGSDLAQALGLLHYPVLISAHGIEQ